MPVCCTVSSCVSFPAWLVGNITLLITLCSRNPEPLFRGQTRTYHSIACQVDTLSPMCDKRIFLLWKGRRFSLLWGSSRAESKKENLAATGKKGVGWWWGAGGDKVKPEKEWVMEKPWNLTGQIPSIKKPLGEVLVLKEKHSSAPNTLSLYLKWLDMNLYKKRWKLLQVCEQEHLSSHNKPLINLTRVNLMLHRILF